MIIGCSIISLSIKQSATSRSTNNLDLIIGSVVRSPAMMYHSLITKADGKTVTRYVLEGLMIEKT